MPPPARRRSSGGQRANASRSPADKRRDVRLGGLAEEEQGEVEVVESTQRARGRRSRMASTRRRSSRRGGSGTSTATNSLIRRASLATASRRRRSISSTIWVENRRTRSRSPGRRSWRCSTSPSPGPATARWTVPTGLASLPPPGPATPVIPTAQSLPRARRTPSAIARATGSETAPCSAIISGRHAHQLCLQRVAVGDGGAQEVVAAAGHGGDPLREEAAGARLGGGEGGSGGAQQIADHALQRVLLAGGEDGVAGERGEALHHRLQAGAALGLGTGRGRLQADLAGVGQDGDRLAAELVVGRRDPLLHHRLGEAGDLEHRRLAGDAARARGQPGLEAGGHQPFQLGGHAGEEEQGAAAALDAQPRRRPAVVGEDLGALHHPGLPAVDLGHLPAERTGTGARWRRGPRRRGGARGRGRRRPPRGSRRRPWGRGRR